MHMPGIIAGALAAGVLVAVLRHVPVDRALRTLAVALSVAAAIYVVFVITGGTHGRWLLVEAGGFILFTALAILGLKYSPMVLALAWFAHIAWDAVLHSHDTAFVPQWYPALCIGFDLVIGACIIVRYRRLCNPGTNRKVGRGAASPGNL